MSQLINATPVRQMPAAPREADTLSVTDLVAGYGGLDICRGISIRVAHGELVAIIGPNGSGKSTLLKAILGLVKVKSGSVLFNGVNVTNLATHRLVAAGVSFCPQTDNVFTGMSIEENLEMGAYVRRRVPMDRLAWVYELFPDLAAKRHQRARGLSGGQRQMLSIGRALMLEPTALLLDEPSAGLSPGMVDVVFGRIAEIHDAGTAIVLVEQNARRALQLADRAYVLAAGMTRYEGTGMSMLNDPEIGRLYLGGHAVPESQKS